MPFLTDARESLWNAIDNWGELKTNESDAVATVFGMQYRFDDEQPLTDDITPSISDLPAIAVMPASITPEWWTNEMQSWPFLFDIVLWTQDWSLPEPEDLIEKVFNAIYRAKAATPPGNSVSYVKAATGYSPMRIGPITFSRSLVKDGSDSEAGDPLKVIITRASIVLRCQKDPFQ